MSFANVLIALAIVVVVLLVLGAYLYESLRELQTRVSHADRDLRVQLRYLGELCKQCALTAPEYSEDLPGMWREAEGASASLKVFFASDRFSTLENGARVQQDFTLTGERIASAELLYRSASKSYNIALQIQPTKTVAQFFGMKEVAELPA